MEKSYHVAKAAKSQGFNFVFNYEKVSEEIFTELLEAKLKEVVGPDRMDQFEEFKIKVYEGLESKPVMLGNRNFEIRLKASKKKN